MSTKINTPGIEPGTASGVQAASAFSGAAQGAAAGAAIGSVVPGIGTAIGAVIGGVVGAIGGLFSGSNKKKYKKAARQAEKWYDTGTDRNTALAYNRQIRDFRQQRASAIVQIGAEQGGMQGSAGIGAVSSTGSQGIFNLNFMEGQYFIGKKVDYWNQKAKKYANRAKTTDSLMEAAFSLASTFGSVYGSFGGGSRGSNFMTSGAAGRGGAYEPMINNDLSTIKPPPMYSF